MKEVSTFHFENSEREAMSDVYLYLLCFLCHIYADYSFVSLKLVKLYGSHASHGLSCVPHMAHIFHTSAWHSSRALCVCLAGSLACILYAFSCVNGVAMVRGSTVFICRVEEVTIYTALSSLCAV